MNINVIIYVISFSPFLVVDIVLRILRTAQYRHQVLTYLWLALTGSSCSFVGFSESSQAVNGDYFSFDSWIVTVIRILFDRNYLFKAFVQIVQLCAGVLLLLVNFVKNFLKHFKLGLGNHLDLAIANPWFFVVLFLLQYSFGPFILGRQSAAVGCWYAAKEGGP